MIVIRKFTDQIVYFSPLRDAETPESVLPEQDRPPFQPVILRFVPVGFMPIYFCERITSAPKTTQVANKFLVFVSFFTIKGAFIKLSLLHQQSAYAAEAHRQAVDISQLFLKLNGFLVILVGFFRIH